MRSSITILLSAFLFVSSASGQKSKLKKLIPKAPVGWVSDFDNVFTDAETQMLDSVVFSHKTETGNEIAIVTLTLDSLSIRSINEFEEFTLLLFNKWGIGQKKLDNGVAIIFSRNLRMVRIEIGYGLNSRFTDQEAKSIIDNIIIPDFKKSDYYRGTLNALQEIIKEIK